jgi:drug/metabolite transporter (DMT)-like permease
MKKNKGALTLKIFFLIILTDVVESVAELFFKKGALATGMENVGLRNFSAFTLKILSVPSVWMGILFYAMNFFLWMAVLSRVDLSVAFPIGSATYIIVPILSMLFLHEKVFFLRWVGIILIIMGVYYISKSTKVAPIH